jgi:hypothetical protein
VHWSHSDESEKRKTQVSETSTMAGRGNAPLRWDDDERRLVFDYLGDGRLDPNKVSSAVYLKSLKIKEAKWDKHDNKNFYQNVRQQVASWRLRVKKGAILKNHNRHNVISPGLLLSMSVHGA